MKKLFLTILFTLLIETMAFAVVHFTATAGPMQTTDWGVQWNSVSGKDGIYIYWSFTSGSRNNTDRFEVTNTTLTQILASNITGLPPIIGTIYFTLTNYVTDPATGTQIETPYSDEFSFTLDQKMTGSIFYN